MKKGIIKGAQSIGADKSYIPDETLVTFFQDWLHIHQKRDKLTKEGSELSDIDKKKLRELDRRKVYILDNIIFPSLANLTYFFEAMSSSVRLNNAFEDELKEILDSRTEQQKKELWDELEPEILIFDQTKKEQKIRDLEVAVKQNQDQSIKIKKLEEKLEKITNKIDLFTNTIEYQKLVNKN